MITKYPQPYIIKCSLSEEEYLIKGKIKKSLPHRSITDLHKRENVKRAQHYNSITSRNAQFINVQNTIHTKHSFALSKKVIL